MFDHFLVFELQKSPSYIQRTLFQQDGATSHTVQYISATCLWNFPTEINLQGKSHKLIPTQSWFEPNEQFFLWAYLKSKVYVNNLTYLAQMREYIHYEMAAINESTWSVAPNYF